jgi:hypothetical protein
MVNGPGLPVNGHGRVLDASAIDVRQPLMPEAHAQHRNLVLLERFLRYMEVTRHCRRAWSRRNDDAAETARANDLGPTVLVVPDDPRLTTEGLLDVVR